MPCAAQAAIRDRRRILRSVGLTLSVCRGEVVMHAEMANTS